MHLFSVIGIVVVCGPISTRFVYSLDDLVENTANMMIEVMRQAFHDLGVLLANYKSRSYKMPSKVFLQFDNCGVNKVCSCIDKIITIVSKFTLLITESTHIWLPESSCRKWKFQRGTSQLSNSWPYAHYNRSVF